MNNKSQNTSGRLKRVFALAMICFFPFSNLKGDEKEESGIPDPKYRWDRFSGVPVESENQAYSLILFRFSAAPRKGETAPDGFIREASSQRETTIHNLIGDKPLVLIFGSSSCNQVQLFEEDFAPVYERFRDDFDFAFIYLRAAHPAEGFQPETERESISTETPVESDAETTKDRMATALAYSRERDFPFPVFVDPVDDAIAVRWGAWPSRAFVINPDKTVIYSGGPGPWYFQFTRDGWHSRPPEALERTFKNAPFDRISLEEFLESKTQ